MIDVQGKLSALLGRLATSSDDPAGEDAAGSERAADGHPGAGGGHLGTGGGEGAGVPGGQPAPLQLVSPSPAVTATTTALAAADTAPQPRALSAAERQQVLHVFHDERFCDLAPASVYSTLLDEGSYLCSTSTIHPVAAMLARVTYRLAIGASRNISATLCGGVKS